MKTIFRTRKKELALLILMALSVLGILSVPWEQVNSFKMVSSATLSYVKARVLSVDREALQLDDTETGRYVGTQELTVEILEGEQKGQQVSFSNYLTQTVNVKASAGQVLLICADTPDNAEPYYTVFSYDRSPAVLILLAAFAVTVLAVGRMRGLYSLVGLGYTVFVILFFMVQAIFHGLPALPCTCAAIAAATLAALLLLCGFSRKALVSCAATFLGVALAGAVFLCFSALLHISGYNAGDAEALLLISQGTGLELQPLLLVGVLVSALGAVMDVAVSLASSLSEIRSLHPDCPWQELFRSGMTIGRDMIGTMTNTLILAYVGTSLSTMLILLGYHYQWQQLLNSDYFAIELAQGLASTLGVVLTVPAASLLAARCYAAPARGKRKGLPAADA